MSWGQLLLYLFFYFVGNGDRTSPSILFLRRICIFFVSAALMFSFFQNSMIPTGLAWEDMLYLLYQKYKSAITWGDQDLLNIIFYFNPGRFSFQNAVGIEVCLPCPTEHIPAWSAIGKAWIVPMCPSALPPTPLHLLWGVSFHALPGISQRQVLELLMQKAKCQNLQHSTSFFNNLL